MSKRYELLKTIEDRLEDETGTIYKDAPFRVSLVYPSPYHVAMSSLGYQTIYRILNLREDVVCERAFLPEDLDFWRRSRTSLLTYESQKPAADADMVAFSIAYETEIVGLLECLDLAGIPIRANDRGPGWPLVVFGGPLTNSNPLPAAPFADLIVMGEGEELIHVIIDWWKTSASREAFLRDISALPGIYVPSIHGEVLRPIAQVNDSNLPAYSQIRTPNTELSNMHLVENARGCHRGCTFCVMRRTTNGGMRTVEPERVLATIPDDATRVGLVGAATTDHPKILEILRGIVDSGREVGLSSLRADRLTPEFMELLKRGGAQTLTIGSDGTSARMRKLAQKSIKDHHIIRSAEYVRDYGLRLLKIYMVFGYPEETDEDIEEMLALVEHLSSICKVAIGLSPLVAKKNTPLDGVPYEDQKVLENRFKYIQTRVDKDVEVRAISVRWAWVEYMLAQGGWDMADAAEEAWREGGTYSAWRRAIKKHRKGPAPLKKPATDRLTPGAFLGDVDRRAPSA